MISRTGCLAGYFCEQARQLVHRSLGLAADIQNPIGLRRRDRCNIGRGDIAHINEIAGLAAIAVDVQAVISAQTSGKNADHAAFAAIALPFAVNVGVTQNQIVQSIQRVVHLDIALGCQFA